ncbi:MAG: hypothetical protein AAFX94_15990 [Myxococcota bacterium]
MSEFDTIRAQLNATAQELGGPPGADGTVNEAVTLLIASRTGSEVAPPADATPAYLDRYELGGQVHDAGRVAAQATGFDEVLAARATLVPLREQSIRAHCDSPLVSPSELDVAEGNRLLAHQMGPLVRELRDARMDLDTLISRADRAAQSTDPQAELADIERAHGELVVRIAGLEARLNALQADAAVINGDTTSTERLAAQMSETCDALRAELLLVPNRLDDLNRLLFEGLASDPTASEVIRDLRR